MTAKPWSAKGAHPSQRKNAITASPRALKSFPTGSKSRASGCDGDHR
jgi:hypothetical protein